MLTHAPLGYFFLDAPPEEAIPISDFRTLKSRAIARPSPNLLDTIHAVQHRQAWMRGYLVEEGEPPIAFVGSHTLAESPDDVTTSLRAMLSLQADWARAHASWEDALRALIHRIEEAGVLVMINGIVENNTHRPLDVVVRCEEVLHAGDARSAEAEVGQLMPEREHLGRLRIRTVDEDDGRIRVADREAAVISTRLPVR